MKRTLFAAYVACGLALITPSAFAHEPAALDGGAGAWVIHQLTQADHLIALAVAVCLGAGYVVFKKARAANGMG
ncbi:hypothetical protein [Magnetovibrio sp.]|uniref:hypothetical protein n=1 Tax=Magnetovibrio sp. TaxID=2024836 RepID=UPI002F953332